MTIYNRQYQKLLASELLRYLLLGRLPNLGDISSRIQNALSSKSAITYKYIPQFYKTVFNNELYNKSLRKIKFDIDVFHEELIDMFAEASSTVNFADLYHKINSYELKRLQSELELLLFTVSDADFYFDGFFETFSDNKNVDPALSTKDIVDLSEQCLSLPYGGKNTKRINVGSLIDAVTIDVNIPATRNGDVVSKRQIPGTKFGSIFTDTLETWGYEVITNTSGELEMSITFPLNPDGEIESEFFTTRFELVPHSDGKQTVAVYTSNDNVNYLPLVGYEQGLVLEDQKKIYAMDFETTLVQYVRLVFKKTEHDEEILNQSSTSYRYLFGLKKFAAMQTGRLAQATYISKPVSFKSNETIGKLSLKATQAIPAGCNISYSVAGIIDGKQTSYIPITPVGTPSSTGSSEIITFNTINKKNQKFSVQSSGNDAAISYGTPFQGKTFYRIGPAITVPTVFGTSLLYRGFKSWARDASGSFEIINVDDTYISFEQSDLEAMYTLETESPQVTVLPLGSEGIKKVQLVVTKPPYYDNSRGHNLKPQPGTQNSLLDTRPNYAVYSITHKTSTSRKNVTFTLTSSRTQYLPSSNFIIESTDSSKLPSLSVPSGSVYQEGIDYTFELIDIGGRERPTGRITIPNGSALLDSNGNVLPTTVRFSYIPDKDITHKVSRIQGNKITLDHCSNTQYDSIEVTYRYIPVPPSQIIKSSIRVSNLPSSSSSRIYYVEGKDYVVDPNTGAIQRIPTGSIPTTGSVYVQFSYRGSSSSLQTFTTWCFIAPQGGAQIKFDIDPSTKKNRLVVDSEVGESLFVNSKEGIINITNATSTPVLPYGWVQFIVRSKNPSVNSDYRSNLIDQVIQLKDINKRKIFKEFNFYFNEITAYREPMVEKTLNHLKVNTLLSDHNSFAIDNLTDPFNSYVVINFLPNETDELYTKVPTADSDESNPPSDTSEDFLLVWNEKSDETVAPTQVVVKIELTRKQNVDGALSPKCFDYQLRVGT